LAGVLLALRASLSSGDDLAADPQRTAPVQVVGEVPRPGWYEISERTVHQALRAAGADPAGTPDGPVAPGWRVVVDGADVRLESSGKELVFGLPLDVNRASAPALEALPGVGPVLAAAIVADRESRGPFPDVEALQRVPGIGPVRLAELRDFVTTEPAPP